MGRRGTASNTKASRRNLKLLQAIISSRSPTKPAQSPANLPKWQTGRQEYGVAYINVVGLWGGGGEGFKWSTYVFVLIGS